MKNLQPWRRGKYFPPLTWPGNEAKIVFSLFFYGRALCPLTCNVPFVVWV